MLQALAIPARVPPYNQGRIELEVGKRDVPETWTSHIGTVSANLEPVDPQDWFPGGVCEFDVEGQQRRGGLDP